MARGALSARERRSGEASAPRLRTSAPSPGTPAEATAWAFPLSPKRASAVPGSPAGRGSPRVAELKGGGTRLAPAACERASERPDPLPPLPLPGGGGGGGGTQAFPRLQRSLGVEPGSVAPAVSFPGAHRHRTHSIRAHTHVLPAGFPGSASRLLLPQLLAPTPPPAAASPRPPAWEPAGRPGG